MFTPLALFATALQFLTRLPVPPCAGFQTNWLPRALIYFPLVGALIGLFNVGVWWLAAHWFPPALAVGLTLAASLCLTGALHEDGFADVCDGFGGATTRARILEIMKDSRIGVYGALGLGMMVALKWFALAALPSAAIALTVTGAHMLSRWCATGLLCVLPYARVSDDAKSIPFADGIGLRPWLLSGGLGMVALLPVAGLSGAFQDPHLLTAITVGGLCAVGSAVLLAGYFRHHLGGYTGDCLGATQQVAELCFLLATLGPLGTL